MFKLKTDRKRSFEFEIDGVKHSTPTAGELPMRWIERFIEAYGIEDENERGGAIMLLLRDFFGEYVGSDVIGELSTDEFNSLCEAWNEATEDADGATPGE